MSQQKPRLLYIDDDEVLARLVAHVLERQGFEVVHAVSGDAGLELIAAGGIDVVALDQYMPDLDGLDTLKRICAVPNAPPVVFVTASQDSKIAVTALQAGADYYLVKDTQGEFVPLLHVAYERRLAPRWRFLADLDGLAAPQGRAFDLSARLLYDVDRRWSLGVGYRTLEGGADNDEVYTFSWLHQVFVALEARF